MRKIVFYITLLCLASLLLESCDNTKYLPQGESLYVGSRVNIKNRAKTSRRESKQLAAELNSLVRPRPNTTILGMRLKLTAYNFAGKFPKFLQKSLRDKMGEPPVLASSLNLEKNRKILQSHLENRGFFKDSVRADTVSKRRRVTAVFTADPGPRYKIDSISFPTDSSTVSRHIYAHMKGTLLKKGDFYNLATIRDERLRIDAALKNEGFFYFSPDYLIVNVDSSVGNHQVNLYMTVKPYTPVEATQVYNIHDIIVYADYEINDDTIKVKPDTVTKAGYYIVDPQKRFRPIIFDRTLIFKPGAIYRRDDHNLSLSRLTTLGVYKFVKVRFEPTDTVLGNSLNAKYFLTRLPRMSARAEVSGLTRTDNSTGTDISLSWKNRNLLRGAELFTLSASVGAERQISGQYNVATYRAGFDANLYVPRILAPFSLNTNGGFVPKTRFNLGYQLFNRNTEYTLNSFHALAGYVWKQSMETELQLNLVNINYVNPLHITPAFQSRMDTNIVLKRTIERQFILGSSYNYNYNSQAIQNTKRDNFYFNGNIDLSGNLYGLLTGANYKKGKVNYLFGAPVSQYTRLEGDGRYYRHLGGDKANQLATRLILGSAWAYGNSEFVPFTKEFFAGGTNDLRGFRARSVGPGTYRDPNEQNKAGLRFIPEQPGDIKIEMNAEWRMKLYSIFNGALFVDAGNVWTHKEDPARPGSAFTKNFLRQMAVDAGAGVRFDLNFLVLRVDVALPISDPRGGGYNFGKFSVGNLVWNLAIGYPF